MMAALLITSCVIGTLTFCIVGLAWYLDKCVQTAKEKSGENI